MPSADSTTRLATAAVTTTLLIALACLSAPAITIWQRGKLAQLLVEQVEAAEDRAVKVPLRQLSELGDQALEPLIVASASERAAVAAVARQIVGEKLAAWQLLAEAATPQHVDRDFVVSANRLAALLAAHIERFGPEGKQWAERLALAMIQLSDRLPAQPSAALLADCSRVLAAVPPRGPRLRTAAPLAETRSAGPLAALTAAPLKLEPLTRSSDSSLEILARLQPNTSPAIRHSTTLEFQGRLPSVPPEPAAGALGATRPAGRELNWLQQPSTELKHSTTASPITVVDTIREDAAERPETASRRVIDVPTPQEMLKQIAVLRQLTSEALLLRLQRASFYEAGIIRTVLGERGFTAAEFLLMQRLSGPDAQDRLRLVEDVSVLPAAQARRFLRWLLDDTSADVRLRALTALATTRAPDLLEIARELAVRDEDARVAELASRLLHQVR